MEVVQDGERFPLAADDVGEDGFGDVGAICAGGVAGVDGRARNFVR